MYGSAVQLFLLLLLSSPVRSEEATRAQEIEAARQEKAGQLAPDDTSRLERALVWAARQVMAFRDEEIRAIVETGRYSDPKSVDWITKCLIVRRDKIGRTYFARVLPLDRFQIAGDRLEFEDLAVKYGFTPPRQYQVEWSRFDNHTGQKVPLPDRTDFTVPAEARNAQPGEYFAAGIRAEDPKKTVTVYLRRGNRGSEVVGIGRTW